MAVAAAVVVAALAGLCLLAPAYEAWWQVSGVETDLLGRFDPPSATHPLGTDDAGRDELARLLHGGRVSLLVGVVSALGASLLGTAVGAGAGYAGGRADAVAMRLTDLVISLPALPLLIILAALDLHKLGVPEAAIRDGSAAVWRIVLILILLGWTGVARLVRAQTLALREREFVEAARATGAGTARILGRHIVPNALSPVIVATTLGGGRAILAESALSFLGVGIQPPATSWGGMLNNAQELVNDAPLLALWPGLLILVVVVCVNLLGDGLQAALDPRRSSP